MYWAKVAAFEAASRSTWPAPAGRKGDELLTMIFPLSVSASVKVSVALITPSLKWSALPRAPIS